MRPSEARVRCSLDIVKSIQYSEVVHRDKNFDALMRRDTSGKRRGRCTVSRMIECVSSLQLLIAAVKGNTCRQARRVSSRLRSGNTNLNSTGRQTSWTDSQGISSLSRQLRTRLKHHPGGPYAHDRPDTSVALNMSRASWLGFITSHKP